jgi:hypothetical protein
LRCARWWRPSFSWAAIGRRRSPAAIPVIARRCEYETVPPLSDGGDPWQQIGAGTTFTCGLHVSGKVECWGMGPHGELGNGATAWNTPGKSFVRW